jgi:hypothetical protein
MKLCHWSAHCLVWVAEGTLSINYCRDSNEIKPLKSFQTSIFNNFHQLSRHVLFHPLLFHQPWPKSTITVSRHHFYLTRWLNLFSVYRQLEFTNLTLLLKSRPLALLFIVSGPLRAERASPVKCSGRLPVDRGRRSSIPQFMFRFPR